MDSKNIAYYQQTYIKYAPMLIRFANKFVSEFIAEDMVQDVFVRLWEKQLFLLPEKEIKNILFVAVKNACLDYLRKISREKDMIDKRAIELTLDELDFFEAADELFMRNDLMDLLLKKIDTLPERSQIVFRKFYLEGMKTAEIAEELEVSVRTVENQLYRSLQALRKENLLLLLYLFTSILLYF